MASHPSKLQSKLNSYLSSNTEAVSDVLQWWNDRCSTHPHLSQMALDYLSIPGMLYVVYVVEMAADSFMSVVKATSIDVECIFSCGWLLSHVHS